MKTRLHLIPFFMLPILALLCAGCGKSDEGDRAETDLPEMVWPPASTPEPVMPDKDRLSYALGVRIGNALQNMQMQIGDVDPEAVAQAIDDVQNDRPLALTESERMTVVRAFEETRMREREKQTEEQAQQQLAEKKRWEEQAARNLEEGERFFEANRKKEGVVELPSGLQYKVIREGTGASPAATDTVKCHYRGTYIDGKEFDSSYARGEPIIGSASGFIAGWIEALSLMKEGAKWELYIPAHLAYGKGQPGFQIPPNSTLIFEMELLEVIK